jgi:hypothetical protein
MLKNIPRRNFGSLLGVVLLANALTACAPEIASDSTENPLQYIGSGSCSKGAFKYTDSEGWTYCLRPNTKLKLTVNCKSTFSSSSHELVCPSGFELTKRFVASSFRYIPVCRQGKIDILPKTRGKACAKFPTKADRTWWLIDSVQAPKPRPAQIETIALANHGVLESGMMATIRGSKGVFGDTPGRIFIGGVEAELHRWVEGGQQRANWSRHEIVIYPRALNPAETLSHGKVVVERADGRRIDGPTLYVLADDNVDDNASAFDIAYNAHVDSYAARHGFDADWVSWMKDDQDHPNPFRAGSETQSNRRRYMGAFQNTNIEHRDIRIAYYVAPEAVLCGLPWPGATAAERNANHMSTLKQFMELRYPGYTFTFNYNGNRADHDLAIWAHGTDGSSRRRFYDNTRPDLGEHYIYLRNDTILTHEFGHFMGLSHHYRDPQLSDAGDGNLMPPGSHSCVMDKRAGWCTGCLAGLNIAPNAFTPENLAEADRLSQILRSHRHDECQEELAN